MEAAPKSRFSIDRYFPLQMRWSFKLTDFVILNVAAHQRKRLKINWDQVEVKLRKWKDCGKIVLKMWRMRNFQMFYSPSSLLSVSFIGAEMFSPFSRGRVDRLTLDMTRKPCSSSKDVPPHIHGLSKSHSRPAQKYRITNKMKKAT